MSKVSGVVEQIKAFPIKSGRSAGQNMHKITVNGVHYGTGIKQEANVGDLVEFDAEQNGEYWNAKNVVNKGKPAAPVAAAPQGTSPQRPYQPQDPEKDKRIAWQAARNASNALVIALVEKDLLVLPKDKKNIITSVAAYSDILTERFYNSSQSLTNKAPAETPAAGGGGDDEFGDEIPF